MATPETPVNGKFFWDNVFFKVEDELFCVPRCEFQTTSEVFANRFPVAHAGTQTEGTDKNAPIVLAKYTKAEFECLLAVMYPRASTLLSDGEIRPFDFGKDELVSVLKLSTEWDMLEIRKYAIHTLSTKHVLSPVDKIRLARSYKVGGWLREGATSLVSEDSHISLDDLAALGWETAARILWIKDTENHAAPIGISNEGPGTEIAFKVGALRCLSCSAKAFPSAPRGPCVSCGGSDDTFMAAKKHIARTKAGNRLQVGLILCRVCKTRAGHFSSGVGMKCCGCAGRITGSSYVTVVLPMGREELVEEAFGEEMNAYKI